MKTTLNVDDNVMRRLKERAAHEQTTVSRLVEAALRSFLDAPPPRRELPPLPTFSTGGALVDVADRDALYEAMESEAPDQGSAGARGCSW